MGEGGEGRGLGVVEECAASGAGGVIPRIWKRMSGYQEKQVLKT